MPTSTPLATSRLITEESLDWPQVTMGIVFGFGILVLGTIIFVVLVRQVFATKRASAELARDAAFRKLTENYDAHLSRTAEHERVVREQLTAVSARLEAIENLLRTVD